MRRPVWLGVAIALVSGLILAGCGGGGAQVEDGATPQRAASPQRVAQCVQNAESAPLSRQVKSELVKICREAGKGNEQAVRNATSRVCQKIVEETVPAGVGREEAVRGCVEAR
jgi:hypothetical protein